MTAPARGAGSPDLGLKIGPDRDDNLRRMWNFLGRLGLSKGGDKRAIDSVFQALDAGDAARPKPTLLCRQCGLKYENTGTYLQGARCPNCTPTR